MAFCVKCGVPLNQGVSFCGSCGAPVGTATATAGISAQPAPPHSGATPASPVAAPKSGRPVVKIILLLLGFFALVTMLGIGSCVYLGYRVHRKAKEVEQAYGLGGPANPTPNSTHEERDACSLLTKEEVAQAIGSPIVESMNDGGMKSKCVYRGPAGSYTQVGLEINWDGGGNLIQLSRMASRAVLGKDATVDVGGIGDEAVAMPMNSGLLVRKGDAAITVDMRMGPKDIGVAKAIAHKALARM